MQRTHFIGESWSAIEPSYHDLEVRRLNAETVERFLLDWTRLRDRVSETHARLSVATTVNTADEVAAAQYSAFLEGTYPHYEAAEQRLKEKLLASGLEPPGMALPLRKLRAQADLFREENLPLQVEEQKLEKAFDRLTGAQTVEWEGRELTLPQLRPLYQSPDRAVREKAWRLGMQRALADRQAIGDLWQRVLGLRRRMAQVAGHADYRSYRWQQLLRFDYSPEDCARFRAAIEDAVVPAARRIYESRRQRLGVERLRPWDLDVDPLVRPPLRPFRHVAELEETCSRIFRRLDPALGAYFDIMRAEGLLDLENRKHKAPGGYCTTFAASRRPFIFANAVGLHDDVQTLLHEAGHAFHVFERARLPYSQQRPSPTEFSEVASMAMELLAMPYLEQARGGFYTAADARRALEEHLEGIILFWPYMAVVDGFQHWVYLNPDAAADPSRCDAEWLALWQRFMPGVDWSGLEEAAMTGWQRKQHILTDPFYYVEYGLAQLGAVQVWAQAREREPAALAAYKGALALGGTVSIPELYAAAGARFAMDAHTLGAAVRLTLAALEEG